MEIFKLVVLTAVLVILVTVFFAVSVIEHEQKTFDICNNTCSEHGLPMLGYKGNRCVCVSGIGVRYYFDIVYTEE